MVIGVQSLVVPALPSLDSEHSPGPRADGKKRGPVAGMCCMLNWADELLRLLYAVVGGKSAFLCCSYSSLKMLLGAWKHRYWFVHVCVRSRGYASLCLIPQAY